MRFCVDLKFDFRGRQLERAALCALPPQHACDSVHAPQVCADLVLQPLVVDAGLRLCIRQRCPAPAGQTRVGRQSPYEDTPAVITRTQNTWRLQRLSIVADEQVQRPAAMLLIYCLVAEV